MRKTTTSTFLYSPSKKQQFCHCPSIAIVGNRCLCVWYCYPEKEHLQAQLVLAESDHEGNWNSRSIINLPLTGSLGNPFLFWDEALHRLYLYFVVLHGHYWDRCEMMSCYSDDIGQRWSKPRSCGRPMGEMIRHPPQHIGGRYLLTTYGEKSQRIHILFSSQPDGPWTEHCALQPNHIQADLTSSGKNVALFTRPTENPRVVHCSRSGDSGRTWSPLFATTLPCPLSGIATALWCGRIVCIHNGTTEHQRWPLSLSWSADGGRNWLGTIHFETAQLEVSYPSIAVDAQDRLHIAYTFNRRMIKHSVFEPSWWDSHS